MALPLIGLLGKAVAFLPVLKRKGVQGGVATAAAGALGLTATNTGILTDPQLVNTINALSQLAIAVGTVVAALKGRKPRTHARAKPAA